MISYLQIKVLIKRNFIINLHQISNVYHFYTAKSCFRNKKECYKMLRNSLLYFHPFTRIHIFIQSKKEHSLKLMKVFFQQNVKKNLYTIFAAEHKLVTFQVQRRPRDKL